MMCAFSLLLLCHFIYFCLFFMLLHSCIRKWATATLYGHTHTHIRNWIGCFRVYLYISISINLSPFQIFFLSCLFCITISCRRRIEEKWKKKLYSIKIKRSLMLIVFINRVFVCKSVVVRSLPFILFPAPIDWKKKTRAHTLNDSTQCE